MAARTIPARLYKYQVAIHAEAMVTRGQVRVGTLHEYRDADRLGDEVGDSREGCLSTIQEFTEETVITSSNIPSFLAGALAIQNGGKLIGAAGSRIIREEEVSNC